MTRITPELLLHGYRVGIFPMAEHRDDPEMFWVDPRKRGVLPLDGFHLSRSLARRMRKPRYSASLNADFATVLDRCADRGDTWINAPIASLYRELHGLGHAHSMEIHEDGQLIGGVYGVTLGAAFFGESMFSSRVDGSKMALACLVDLLRRCGFMLFDTQFLTDHLASLGAIEISRAAYQSRLAEAQEADADITALPVPQPQEVIQRITQTS